MPTTSGRAASAAARGSNGRTHTWNVALEAGGLLVSEEVKIDLEIAADEVAPAARSAAQAA